MLPYTRDHFATDVWTIDVSPNDLATALVADLRSHPHFSNVLTHVANADWPRLEVAFSRLLDPARSVDFTPLLKNILVLACSGDGTTGRMLEPWFKDWLRQACGPSEAEATLERFSRLYGLAVAAPAVRKKSAMRILREHDERCAAAALPVAEGA